MVESRQVLVSGAVAEKPARLVGPEEPVVITVARRFVGRGGEKLDAALDRFGIDVGGLRVLDAGASTGGFTDCLLRRGAAHVVALDVGRLQLHERLRGDPRVTCMEQTDVRDAETAVRGERFPLVVADLSFISLRTVAGSLVALAEESATLLVLVKPQFEAGRRAASKGRGVIRSPELWREALAGVNAAFSAHGAAMMGVMPSPVRGAAGNVEFFMYLGAGSDEPPSLGELIDSAVDEVG